MMDYIKEIETLNRWKERAMEADRVDKRMTLTDALFFDLECLKLRMQLEMLTEIKKALQRIAE